jgi:hypothetical protein
MKALFANRQRTLILAGAFLVLTLLVVFTVARAQSGAPTGGVVSSKPNDPAIISTPVPGGPGYISLNGIDFKPLTPTDNTFSYTGVSIRNAGVSPDWFMATFQVPNGATINKVVAYYTDTDASAGMDLEVDLLYVPLDSAYGILMADFHSTGATGGLLVNEITTITHPVVDLAANTYLIQAYLPNSTNVSLVGVRVDYAYRGVLPAVMK